MTLHEGILMQSQGIGMSNFKRNTWKSVYWMRTMSKKVDFWLILISSIYLLVRSAAHRNWGWDYDVSPLSLLDHCNKLFSSQLLGVGVGRADCLGGPQSLLPHGMEFSIKWVITPTQIPQTKTFAFNDGLHFRFNHSTLHMQCLITSAENGRCLQSSVFVVVWLSGEFKKAAETKTSLENIFFSVG